MGGANELLPIKQTLEPTAQSDVALAIRDACATGTPIYPIGGGTNLEYGVPAKTPGIGLKLAKLNRVIEYPARDMTITLEAGVTMQQLADVLATENQQLPVDVPHADRATIGGVIATNWNGARRYGCGPLRDFVIGISAVDGQGMAFKGGGRVVKNVAGYDFCKLLTGSMGVLGVITQVTLKVRPLPVKSALMVVAAKSADEAERFLASLVSSTITPVAVQLISGRQWAGELGREAHSFIAVAIEGTEPEVDWMQTQLARESQTAGLGAALTVDRETLWPKLVNWTATGESPLVVKANVRPSGVVPLVEKVREIDPQCEVLAHASSGLVFVKFSVFPKNGLSRMLVGQLQPIAASLGGQVVILSNPSQAEMTRQSVWGGNPGSLALMQAVKQKFDPKDILNPGRFIV